MRNLNFCFVFLMFSLLITTSTWSQGNDSIRKYYQLRNQAELAIIDANYSQALSIYKNAFKWHRPHEKDIYNAFIASCILKDTANAKTFFDMLTYLGLPQESLTDDLKQDRIDTNIVKAIATDYKTIRAKSLASELPVNAAYMDTLYVLDQGARRLAMNTGDQNTYRDSIRRVDSTNVSRMIKFIKKKGFPDIYKTGFYAENYRHISSCPMIYLLLRHTMPVYSTRPDKAELMKLVKAAVMEGKYDARDYAFFYDESETNTYGTVFKSSFTEDGKQVFDPIDPAEIEKINKARSEIYLENLDDYKKKLEFMRRSYYFHFVNVFTVLYNHIRYDPNSVKRD